MGAYADAVDAMEAALVDAGFTISEVRYAELLPDHTAGTEVMVEWESADSQALSPGVTLDEFGVTVSTRIDTLGTVSASIGTAHDTASSIRSAVCPVGGYSTSDVRVTFDGQTVTDDGATRVLEVLFTARLTT